MPAGSTARPGTNALLNGYAEVVQLLDQIRQLGVYIAIDDFGTEHSSLSRLRDMPAEVLKIDRSFVDGLGSETGDTAETHENPAIRH